ncbi:carbamoyl phosphate synthase large subunit [Hyphomicrobium methylovorum]|uniref:carbamoyl-phosphate synthase large subunit n=1 Tax=Hyphomicrobium methylovorum TaxID=84 RepID=UPI0015E6552F|nr:carbamoyl-phosphate synthase large subunit [Hyphomicrobium methylovorum]MBA2124823.1 carbamoyl phosphate synthase large subunit [Hyphomicrobium methylovorum]
MPKRTDIKSILIIGAGPIVIGQACEFDYSGTQACKALRAEGYRIILVNSNPATIMTDPDLADATYIEPITPEVVAKILQKERPDAILPTMGGQTALNTALALHKQGILKQLGVELIGAKAEAIDKAEDRKLFREAMDRIGLESPRAAIASSPEIRNQDGKVVDYDRASGFVEAMRALDRIGLPAIIRPAFTLGGTGGGVAYNREEFEQIVRSGLDASPVGQILIDESLLGWKEYEMEVVRDKADNCIIICSIENIDPMGVHTGDSITVAPALTLTDKEYQMMRDASIAVLREIGVETGGSNVQFAVNPATGRLVVIEMNPRVSRSSALASKATGFPIAKVAAKLAVGYTLDEIQNEITGGATPASFEPTIDYVVTKIPRFAFEKFPGADTTLTTAMKSVGEAMAIGRTFQESMQKALRSMETGLTGFDDIQFEGLGQGDDKNVVRAAVSRPTSDRVLKVAQAFREGFSIEEIHQYCKIDPWFLSEIKAIIDTEARVIAHGLPKTKTQFRALKAQGFSDARLSKLARMSEADVRQARQALDVTPVFKRIDTCAAEFASPTAYMYSTYESGLSGEPVCEATPTDKEKIIILGGGPNRIGQGIEFDYCCCHACFSLTAAGFETIMVNCNPETVSTDYDTSDRLFFEPLTAEDVLEIIRVESSNGKLKGVIVQFGGQTPLKLASALEEAGVSILGTSPDAIDLAEDRDRFKVLIDKLKLSQPKSGIARTPGEARSVAETIGYPVVIRPSYVLGGRAMEIVHDGAEIDRYVTRLSATLNSPSELLVSDKRPLLIDSYLTDAVEVDVDCIADGKDTFIAGIMEHIEEAGIHSGDSGCSLPPHSLSAEIIAELERQTRELALALRVVGLMNVQFAIKDGQVFILEVNPRASRTVPFVAKVVGLPIAAIASEVMAGKPLAEFKLRKPQFDHIAVKEAVFPFARFLGVDPILGPEMRSTGEVMGIDRDFAMAFGKSQLGAGLKLPSGGTVFVSVKEGDKARVVAPVRELASMGFKIIATRGTKRYLEGHGIACDAINKVLEGRPHIVDAMKNGDVQLVFNTTEGSKALSDSKDIRRTALLHHIPYYTTLAGTVAVTRAIRALNSDTLQVAPLQAFAHR